MAGVASNDRQIQLQHRILRPINGLRYTRQPSCIIRARRHDWFPCDFRYRYLWESRRADMPAPIPELSVVRLTHSFEHDARKLPEGTVGTVVHAWHDGEHYAVEFRP